MSSSTRTSQAANSLRKPSPPRGTNVQRRAYRRLPNLQKHSSILARFERCASRGRRMVLLLFDEVLNFFNRHRKLAEPFHAFIQNLTVAITATNRGAALISLPRSQVEMTDWDL